MPGGRPTKYKPEYCDEIVEFFSVEPTREVEVVTIDKKGNESVRYEQKPNPLPQLVHFAAKIGVDDDTIVEWAKKHKEFSAAYNKTKRLQKAFLIENGLHAGRYAPAFAIFTAKNITDMRDVIETEITGKDGGAIPVIMLPPLKAHGGDKAKDKAQGS